MKRFILVLLMAGLVFTASSQKVYFLYLQAEPAQPFFVKLNGKVHSSSATGYLILSRLIDTTYTFTAGFSRTGVPEQVFTVKMGQKDHGFLLKDFGDKGWGIFDLQTLSIQYSETAIKKTVQQQATPEKEVSPFTDLLSKATGDPSLRDKPPAPKAEEKPVVKPEVAVTEPASTVPAKPVTAEEPKTETVIPPVVAEKKPDLPPAKIEAEAVKAEPVAVAGKEEKKEDPVAAVKEPAPKQAVVIDTVVKAPVVIEEKKAEPKNVTGQLPVNTREAPPVVTEEVPAIVYKKSVVTKRSESSTTEGFGLVFMDTWEGGKIDTIRLLIPNPKQVVALVKEAPKQDKKFLEIQASAVKPEEKAPVTEEKPKQTEPVRPANEVKTEEKTVVATEKTGNPGPCAETASETDFFALRKSMAAAEGDDEMISQAKKYFKQKCFTAAQLKNLSALFLNDEAKYNFFDAAYKYTADKSAFATLESELKDPYYINRFKAMIR